jgi:vitamin B12 transporter
MNPYLNPLYAVLASLAIGSTTTLTAQSASPPVDEVVVTASRIAEPLDDALAPVSVITREDIERLQATDLLDIFTGLPGINFASNGGPGKSSSLFVRGTESDHVLVLVDGIKVGSATSGSTPFEQIPLEQIERVEIVRGPRSSLYGSEAIGGVIHIITRRGSGEGLTPAFAVGGGTRGDRRLEAGLRGGNGHSWFSAGLSGRTTDGVDAQPVLDEPDRDGYRNLAASLRAGHVFANGADISASALHVEGKNAFDGSFQNFSDTVTRTVGLTGRFTPRDAWRVSLSGGQSRDESDNFLDGTFVSRFRTRRDTLSLQNDITLSARHNVSLGADYQNDHIDSTTEYVETRRDNTGLFAVYRGDVGAHELQLSVREDDNAQFGRNTTGGAAYGIRFAGNLRATVSYGTAFKAPTFNELYFPGFGNADLVPEEARNVEVGLTGDGAITQWGVYLFRNEIDDLIAFDVDLGAPSNIDEALIQGIEAQLGTQFGALRLQGYLTWLTPENDGDGANRGNTLPRRRERTARLDVDYDLRAFSTGLTLYGASDGFDNIANTTPLPGYATVNLRFGWQAMPQWLLQLEGRNVLDKDYQTAATYDTYGASVMATVRYTPERI